MCGYQPRPRVWENTKGQRQKQKGDERRGLSGLRQVTEEGVHLQLTLFLSGLFPKFFHVTPTEGHWGESVIGRVQASLYSVPYPSSAPTNTMASSHCPCSQWRLSTQREGTKNDGALVEVAPARCPPGVRED